MPVVNSQKPRPPATSKKPPATSGWGDESGLKILLYGMSGTGKTTFWATFPGKILVLLCSGGRNPGELRSIDTPENRKRITPVKVASISEVKGQLAGADEYDTVVLDHVSGLQDLCLKEILGVNELPAVKNWGMARQQDYGQCATQTIEVCRALLNLPKNVVIVAQERTFGGKDDGLDPGLVKPTIGCDVMPSVAKWLNPACDYVVQTFKRAKYKKTSQTVGNKTVEIQTKVPGVEYCLRCEPHEIYLTKFRTPRGKTGNIPDVIVDPDYSKLLEAIG